MEEARDVDRVSGRAKCGFAFDAFVWLETRGSNSLKVIKRNPWYGLRVISISGQRHSLTTHAARSSSSSRSGKWSERRWLWLVWLRHINQYSIIHFWLALWLKLFSNNIPRVFKFNWNHFTLSDGHQFSLNFWRPRFVGLFWYRSQNLIASLRLFSPNSHFGRASLIEFA